MRRITDIIPPCHHPLSKRPGKASKLADPQYREKLLAMWPILTAADCAKALGLSRRTVERHVAALRQEQQPSAGAQGEN